MLISKFEIMIYIIQDGKRESKLYMSVILIGWTADLIQFLSPPVEIIQPNLSYINPYARKCNYVQSLRYLSFDSRTFITFA